MFCFLEPSNFLLVLRSRSQGEEQTLPSPGVIVGVSMGLVTLSSEPASCVILVGPVPTVMFATAGSLGLSVLHVPVKMESVMMVFLGLGTACHVTLIGLESTVMTVLQIDMELAALVFVLVSMGSVMMAQVGVEVVHVLGAGQGLIVTSVLLVIMGPAAFPVPV